MKRDSSGNQLDGPAAKFQRSSDLSNVIIRFLIPGRAAGIMIGKGGENIKKIRSQFNVKLNIPDSRGPERIMTIEGDLQAICNIMRDVSPKLKDIMNAKHSDPKRIMGAPIPGRRGRNRDDDEDFNREDEDDTMLDYRILVHESQAGSVIGRGGERIKELRDKYRMRVIKVYQMLAPMSTDRVVQMVADPDNAVQCLKSVVEAVESAPPRGRRDDYDASNFNEAQALNYGGWLSREAVQALSQGIPLAPGPGSMPPMGYMGGPPYGMGGPMGRGGGRGGMGRPPPRAPGGPGSRGMGGSSRGGPAPVPHPGGPRGMNAPMGGGGGYSGSGGGGYGAMGMSDYDNSSYDNGGFGPMDPPPSGYGGPGYGGSSGGYGGSSYGGGPRSSGDGLPPSGGSRGGTYGGYGMASTGPHDDAKVNQWYGGWS